MFAFFVPFDRIQIYHSSIVYVRPAFYVSSFLSSQMEHQLMQIKDPIQRAGVRLLWAAAIPIQTQMRRYLSRLHAIQRGYVLLSRGRIHLLSAAFPSFLCTGL